MTKSKAALESAKLENLSSASVTAVTTPLPQVTRASFFSGGPIRLFLELILLATLVIVPFVLFGDSRYWLPIFTRLMALAIFAMATDLVWGYTGLLSLGQGLYFGLGAYAVAYSLKMKQAAVEAGLPIGTAAMPDFMLWCRVEEVPDWIVPLANIWTAIALSVLMPTLVSMLFGLYTFRPRMRTRGALLASLAVYLVALTPIAYWWREPLIAHPMAAFAVAVLLPIIFVGGLVIPGARIGGVYFSLVTQALLLAVFTLVDNQQPFTGGRVGMPGLAQLEIFGHTFKNLKHMYWLVTGSLVLCFLICLWLVHSKFGKVLTAIRDSETRTLALGYNTAMYKTFVFAFAGAMSGFAGALYTAAQRTVGPTEVLDIGFSIEIVILVAVGGRGTLIGAVLGTILVIIGKTYVNNEFKQGWPLILGGLFVLVVLFLPQGIIGLLRQTPARLQKLLYRKQELAVSAR
jgi:urea transport system permease protein